MIPTWPRPDGETVRTVDLLVATAVGTYALVVVGVTTGLVDALSGCHGWPVCTEFGPGTITDTAVLVAMTHRVLAAGVGILLAVTTVVTWRRGARPAVRHLLALVALAYPVQVGIGALTAVASPAEGLALAHLVLGMAVFSGLALALLWELEATAGSTVDPADAMHRTRVRTAGGSETGDIPARSPDSSGTAASPPGIRERLGAYLELTKPKLMWLLCLVAVAAMALAGGRTVDPTTAGATIVGGVLAIGASGTFNNVLERDVDRRMDRTDGRPLVEGRIPVRHALTFGVALTVGATAVFLAFVNPLAAALGLLAILFYSVVYTLLLKPHTKQNIVIGGAVGAFPALIGWAAVTETVGVPALVLGAVIFLWTPAHFYNLAMAYRADYARADFPMLPVVDGEARTRRHILLYLAATMVGAVLLGTQARLGWVYGLTILVVGAGFLTTVARQYREPTRTVIMRTFHASNAYLGALLIAVVVDSLLL